ncbi:MAG: hypothetical protein ACRD2B_10565 [Terriglobia bacterium]
MDVEKTIEFLLENQARFDARMEANFDRAEARFIQAEKRMDQAENRMDEAEKRMDRAEKRMDRAEKRLDRVERIVAQMATVGLKFRNEMRRAEMRHERKIAEIDHKLNASKTTRRNGRKGSNGR